jgi:hypothetical protein
MPGIVVVLAEGLVVPGVLRIEDDVDCEVVVVVVPGVVELEEVLGAKVPGVVAVVQGLVSGVPVGAIDPGVCPLGDALGD